MKANKKDIIKLQRLLKNADLAELKSQNAQSALAGHIIDMFGVDGFIDHLQGDGMGFTPSSNNDTHVGVSELIEAAKQGIDITEEWMLSNLTL